MVLATELAPPARERPEIRIVHLPQSILALFRSADARGSQTRDDGVRHVDVDERGEEQDRFAHDDQKQSLVGLGDQPIPVHALTRRAKYHRGVCDPSHRGHRVVSGAVHADVHQQIGRVRCAKPALVNRHRVGVPPDRRIRALEAAVVEHVPVQITFLFLRIDETDTGVHVDVNRPLGDEKARARWRF